ncbi:hypothetical protein N431DRAFT_503973 [Stipitochalara longipes BDJ]|nr:hypothetical protein N431DRAFT_503973 [Stipitochalara longipes BDJ]
MPTKYGDQSFRKLLLLMSLGETITLAVGTGDNISEFVVHKNVVCAASPFVAAACKLEWSIKRRRFDCMTTTELAMRTIWGLLAKLYVCGDKYQMPRLQNHAIDGMIDFPNLSALTAPE